MKVFISWSGERSRAVAEELRRWIPMVLQTFDVWMSTEDVQKGAHWDVEIAERLNSSNEGIVCLTPENVQRPWILFESGALSKQVTKARVCTYLLGLQPQDVPPPLGMFQHTVAVKGDTLKLLRTLNASSERQLEPEQLDRLFEVTWPEVAKRLNDIPEAVDAAPARSTDEMLAEVLDLARSRGGTESTTAILSKLQHIELALFVLSYRSVGKVQFEEIAFNILNASRRVYKGSDESEGLLKDIWTLFEGVVREHKADRKTAAKAKLSTAAEAASTGAPASSSQNP